jgi:hypothetical protein
MSEMATEELKMEYRALQLLAILVEDKLSINIKRKGLFASEIKKKMNDRIINHKCSDDDISTLIDKMRNRWIYNKDTPLEGFEHIEINKNNEQAKWRYSISDKITNEMWNQLLRVALCLALLRYGKITNLENNESLSDKKMKDFLNLMNLVTAFEKDKKLDAKNRKFDGKRRIKPVKIEIDTSTLVYTWNEDQEKTITLADLISGEVSLI